MAFVDPQEREGAERADEGGGRRSGGLPRSPTEPVAQQRNAFKPYRTALSNWSATACISIRNSGGCFGKRRAAAAFYTSRPSPCPWPSVLW